MMAPEIPGSVAYWESAIVLYRRTVARRGVDLVRLRRMIT
jgi:hypothetical protein